MGFLEVKILEWLYQQYVQQPDKCAVYYNGQSMTYRTLYVDALYYARKIKNLEVDRIAVYIDNSMDAVLLVHAMMLARVEMVLVNTRLTDSEINAQLNDVDVNTIITTMDFILQDKRVIEFGALKEMDGKPFEVKSPHSDDILSIMFTSGTTGKPKAVAQTYLNHYTSAAGCEERFGYDDTSTWLLVNPMYHISGLSIVFRTVIAGSKLVVAGKFDEEKIIQLLHEKHITHTSLVPVMLERLLSYEWHHQLEGILLGGAGTTRSLLSKALKRDLPVYNSFGMTETCSQIVSVSYKDDKILNGTVGRPLDNVSIKVDGNDELLVRADSVTRQYLNAPIDIEDGYFKTGDMARIDDEGYLYILDRRKDLIISGGENIYPKEIEDAADEIPGVKRSVAIKREDDKWGEVPVLLIEGHATEDDIKDELTSKMARFKQPKEIVYVDEVIMTSTGKVSRAGNSKLYERIKGE